MAVTGPSASPWAIGRRWSGWPRPLTHGGLLGLRRSRYDLHLRVRSSGGESSGRRTRPGFPLRAKAKRTATHGSVIGPATVDRELRGCRCRAGGCDSTQTWRAGVMQPTNGLRRSGCISHRPAGKGGFSLLHALCERPFNILAPHGLIIEGQLLHARLHVSELV